MDAPIARLICLHHAESGNVIRQQAGALPKAPLTARGREQAVAAALFVIIGRKTFSAAQNTVTAIERETSAIFVGEPTRSRPNFIGESIVFELPYSKLRANAADLRGLPPQPGPGNERHPRHPRTRTPASRS